MLFNNSETSSHAALVAIGSKCHLCADGHPDLAGHVKLVDLHKAADPDGEVGLFGLAICQRDVYRVRQDVVHHQRRLEGHHILRQDVAGDAILGYHLRLKGGS